MDQRLYHCVSFLLHHIFLFPQRSCSPQTQPHGSRGKVVKVLSFQGKFKKWECQDQKEPKLYHNLSNSEPMMSTLTSPPPPQLHFLLLPIQGTAPPSTPGSSHQHGNPLGLTHFPHHYPRARSTQSPKSFQGYSFFSSLPLPPLFRPSLPLV